MDIVGVKVVDAKKPLKISITVADVKKGNTKDPAGCAAAVACLRQPHVTQARVHLSRVYLKIGGKWIRCLTPQSLRSEIIAFDRGGEFAPGKHILAPPNPSRELGAKHKPGRATKTHPQRAPKGRVYHTVADVRKHGANR